MQQLPIRTVKTVPNGTSARVLKVILEDPGVNCGHILEQLESDPECGDITGRQISNSLAFLRRTNQIQNLGKHSRGASWYPAD